jgi:hypothetical protein
MQGCRGGVDLPHGDIDRVKNQLAKYLREDERHATVGAGPMTIMTAEPLPPGPDPETPPEEPTPGPVDPIPPGPDEPTPAP